MKQFLFIRHAKSSWSHPELEDIKRPLNKRGIRDAPFMAAYCRAKDLIPDALISSPATRAYATASYFYNEFANENKCFDKESDLYFGSESDWLFLINELQDDYLFPAFFSHNPTITFFSNKFSRELLDNVPTCGIIYLTSSATSWKDVDYNNTTVKNYYFPKLVRKL